MGKLTQEELRAKAQAAAPGSKVEPLPENFGANNTGTIINQCYIEGPKMSDKQAEAISAIANASMHHAYALQRLAEAIGDLHTLKIVGGAK